MTEIVVSPEFTDGLRCLREASGGPSLRTMETMTHFSRTWLATVLRQDKLPPLPLTLAWVRACGGDTELWEARWREEERRIRAMATPDAKSMFFGRELAHDRTVLVYPAFCVSKQVTDVLANAGLEMEYQRSSDIGVPGDFWIDVPQIVAENDVKAVMQISSLFDSTPSCPNVVLPDSAVARASNRAFISVGLSSNACTVRYFNRAKHRSLFTLLPEGDGSRRFARLPDGRTFHSDPRREWGLIVRFAPDPEDVPHRRWFIVGGMGPMGTIGAASYLAGHWQHLAGLVPADRDFAAFVRVPVSAPDNAHLDDEHVVSVRADLNERIRWHAAEDAGVPLAGTLLNRWIALAGGDAAGIGARLILRHHRLRTGTHRLAALAAALDAADALTGTDLERTCESYGAWFLGASATTDGCIQLARRRLAKATLDPPLTSAQIHRITQVISMRQYATP